MRSGTLEHHGLLIDIVVFPGTYNLTASSPESNSARVHLLFGYSPSLSWRYHLPNWRTIGLTVWQRVAAFLKKAGTVILAVSIVVWLVTFRRGRGQQLYAALGRLLEPVGRLMGLGWRRGEDLGFVARRTLSPRWLFCSGWEEAGTLRSSWEQHSRRLLPGLSWSRCYSPCVSTLAVIRQETEHGVGYSKRAVSNTDLPVAGIATPSWAPLALRGIHARESAPVGR